MIWIDFSDFCLLSRDEFPSPARKRNELRNLKLVLQLLDVDTRDGAHAPCSQGK